MEHFEEKLSKFINNENIADDKKYFYFNMYFDEWAGISPITWDH